MISFGDVELWLAIAMLPGVVVGLGHVLASLAPSRRWWVRSPFSRAKDDRFSEDQVAMVTSVATVLMVSVYAMGGALLLMSAGGTVRAPLGAWVLALGVMFQWSVWRVRNRDLRAAATGAVALVAGVVLAAIWLTVQVNAANLSGATPEFGIWLAYATPLAISLLLVGWQTWVAINLTEQLPARPPVYAAVPDDSVWKV